MIQQYPAVAHESPHSLPSRMGCRLFQALGLCAAVLFAHLPVQAQVPADPYDYSRASSFEYDPVTGLLVSETVEPDNLASCVKTTYTYDAYGNRTGSTTGNCAGAVPARQQFSTRSSSTSYTQAQTVTVAGMSVALPSGAFPITATNALSQNESRQFDPRFGAVTQVTGPNSLVTRRELDDFGRVLRETTADGNSTVTYYCYLATAVLDTSANTPGCPTPGAAEVPTGAAMFVHTEARRADTKIGPYARVYTDRQGRKIRTVTEGFDGAGQPALGVVVQDTEYNRYGLPSVSTQPYFLDTGSSRTSGTADQGLVRTDYDTLARVVAVYTSDEQGSQSAVTFGGRGTRRASVVTSTISGLNTTVTTDDGRSRIEEHNVNGLVVRVTDALGAQIAYQHDAFDNLIATRDPLQNTIAVQYDLRGRKVSLKDPDTGLWQYDYNALGETVWQQNATQRAAGTATTMAYDRLGRLVQRSEPEYVSNWTYDSYADGSACFKGKLCESATSHGIQRKLVYDSLGRPTSSRTAVNGGPAFATAVSYDAQGRLASRTYPTGLKVAYTYTARGYTEKLTLATAATLNALPATPGGSAPPPVSLPAGSLLWQGQVYDAWGHAEKQLYGNGVLNRAGFDANGRLAQLSAGAGTATNVLNLSYGWDGMGRLVSRGDANGDGLSGAVSDSYTYDALGRLTRYTVAAPAIPNLTRTVDLQYNALGLLLYKSDVGIYTYRPSGPNAVTPHAVASVNGSIGTSGSASYTYDANGNLSAATDGRYRQLSHTSFNLPDAQVGVQGAADVSGGTAHYAWQYDEGHQRIKETRVVTGGGQAGTRTTWMLHPDNAGGLGFESEVNVPSVASAANPAVTSNRHYLSVGGASIGVLVSTGALPALAASQTAPTALAGMVLVKAEYWHKDHLGSLSATTDALGAVTARYAYDPFGKRRYTKGTVDAGGKLVIDWSPAVNSGTDRGYTGHEHLDDVGLVHMNGRLYDPTLGVFLQGDPYIQSPDDLQNYNRYGYCFNNPVTCTDPSGHRSFLGNFMRWSDGGFAAGFMVGLGDPVATYVTWWGLAGKYSYQIKSIVLGLASAYYCNAWAPLCVGAGQALLAKAYGMSDRDAARAGLVSGATAYAFTVAGSVAPGAGQGANAGATAAGELAAGEAAKATVSAETVAMNTVLHAVIGCVSTKAQGGDCEQGALAAGFSAAYGNYASGDINVAGYSSNPVVGTMQSAAVGGIASVLGGGKFGGWCRNWGIWLSIQLLPSCE